MVSKQQRHDGRRTRARDVDVPAGLPGRAGTRRVPAYAGADELALSHAPGHDPLPRCRCAQERKHLTRAVCSLVRVAGLSSDAGAPVLQGPSLFARV